MASVNTKIDISSLQDQMLKHVTKTYLPDLMKQAVELCIPNIITALHESFNRTIVFQALEGAFADIRDKDVRAHLGLTDGMAHQALYEIENVLVDVLEVAGIKGRRGGKFSSINTATSISFNVSFKRLLEAISSIPSGKYSSDGGTIDWIRALLYGARIDEYRITFRGQAGASFDRSIERGRSGRAKMLVDNSFGGEQGYHWDIDDYNRFTQGSSENFVEEALSDPIWIKEAQRAIEQAIEQIAG